MFLKFQDDALQIFEKFCKHAQNEMGIVLLYWLEVIIEKNLIVMNLKSFVISMAMIITFRLLELLNKIL